MRNLSFLNIIVIAGLLTSTAGAAQQPRHKGYKEWQGRLERGDMPELLSNLREMTDRAARSRSADPAFLEDLRKLAVVYEDQYAHANQWPIKLAHDDFRDGDFTRNPAWTVVAGDWQVTSRGSTPALHSVIVKPQAAAAPSAAAAPATGQDLVAGVLGAIIRQHAGQAAPDQAQPQQPAPATSATILLPIAITNAFAIRLEFASRDAGGQLDFGPYRSQHGDASYNIRYSPAAESGLILTRVTRQGAKMLGSSTGRVGLEDGRPHVIDWRRDAAGKMAVSLDGKLMIEATDAEIRNALDGFAIVNGGGAFWITSVDINGTRN